jgi:AraC-like DNA-binding protein
MQIDRLATLLRGVGIGPVVSEPVGCTGTGPWFWVCAQGVGYDIGLGLAYPDQARVIAALDWPSGAALLQSGPILRQVPTTDALFALTQMLLEEAARPRCGAASLLAAYVEGLLVHLLRGALSAGQDGVGLLAGLAEPRIARALVAMHDRPAQIWTVEDLADAAGMSRSGFMERFRAVLGQTPMAYLRGWRMGQAQGDLLRGARVAEVARRYGYRSADAFARAYHGQFGQMPSTVAR